MPSAAPWILLLAPAALAAVGFMPRADARIGKVTALAQAAALLGLAIALGGVVAVAVNGPAHTVTLGLAGGGLGVQADMLSTAMAALVAFVGAAVIRFSRNYLDGDPRQGRFVQNLCLTVAAVLTMALAGNMVQMAAAWVATSVALNGLLMFRAERPAARLAARKKFVVSRLGDVCLIGAALLLAAAYGAFDFATIAAGARASDGLAPAAATAAILVVLAALLKSAQFPAHGWLLEVMETPTPVSALLHAGVVNAGGFAVLRLADVVALSGPALHLLALVGLVTALVGSLVMLTQTSVKVSLAWSTVAQMGFMMLQCGLGAFSAAFLHIVAHSLYKAHAFLSSGGILDVVRASWSPSPSGQPHPRRLALALAAVLAAALGASWLMGATPVEKPGVFALGAVMLMGLTVLVAGAIDERPNPYVTARALAATAAVAVAYFALQRGMEAALAGALPATLAADGPLDLALVAAVVVMFGGVTLLQTELARHAERPFWRAFWVHLQNGFYLNTVANRLVVRFSPQPLPKA
jgi:NAD(P)H-quinone oxidoreductase subunit 5